MATPLTVGLSPSTLTVKLLKLVVVHTVNLYVPAFLNVSVFFFASNLIPLTNTLLFLFPSITAPFANETNSALSFVEMLIALLALTYLAEPVLREIELVFGLAVVYA